MADPFPRYYAVNGRPVQIVATPDDGADALVFDSATGAFVPDRSSFGRVAVTGVGEDVDRLTADEFAGLVAALRQPIAARRRASPIVWEDTGDGEFPYRVRVRGKTLTIRINDFPAAPLYTLLVDGQEVEDLEEWPAAWVRPALTAAPLDVLEQNEQQA
jgi:hypothetical protein